MRHYARSRARIFARTRFSLRNGMAKKEHDIDAADRDIDAADRDRDIDAVDRDRDIDAADSEQFSRVGALRGVR